MGTPLKAPIFLWYIVRTTKPTGTLDIIRQFMIYIQLSVSIGGSDEDSGTAAG